MLVFVCLFCFVLFFVLFYIRSVCLFLSLFLGLCLPACTSVCLSGSVSVSMSLSLYLCLPVRPVSVCLYICLSVCPSLLSFSHPPSPSLFLFQSVADISTGRVPVTIRILSRRRPACVHHSCHLSRHLCQQPHHHRGRRLLPWQ